MKYNQYKVMIITCWILLGLAFICKLLGANWFEPSVDSEKFIKFCKWLDNHWEVYILTTAVYIPATYLPYLAITEQKMFKDFWVCLILLPCSWLKDQTFILIILGFILELTVLVIIPMFKLKCKKKIRILVGLVLISIFQIISTLTKIWTWHLANQTILIELLVSIDYYIMIVLYFLYSLKKGKVII